MRLGGTLIAGLLLVRLLVEFGPGVYAVVALLQTTIGYLRMFPDILAQSIVHDLSAGAHAEDDGSALADAFGSALVVCGLVGLAIGASTTLFVIGLDAMFSIPAELRAPGRYLAACIGVQSFAIALTTPSLALLAVRERFAAVNLVTTGQRWTLPLAAGAVLMIPAPDIASMLDRYATLSTILFCSWQAGAVIWIHRSAPVPLARAHVTPTQCRRMLGLGGWAGMVNIAMVVQTVFGATLMNQTFGVTGNAAYGIAVQLGGYIRMAANGMALGLEAISARFTRGGDAPARRTIVHYATMANAWAAFAALPVIAMHVETWLRLWLGDPAGNPGLDYEPTALLVLAFALGSTFFGIFDGWRKVLVGAGHARALGISTAAIITLALPPSLIATWYGPPWLQLQGPGLPFTLFLPLFGTIASLAILHRWTGASATTLLAPIARAALTAGLATAVAALIGAALDSGTVGALAGSIAYLACYLPLSLFIVIDRPLRARLIAALPLPGRVR